MKSYAPALRRSPRRVARRTSIRTGRGGSARIALLTLSLLSCKPAAEKPEGAYFVEMAEESGVTFEHTDGSSGRYFIVEPFASGVLLFDYDLDGDLDLYLINGRSLPPNPEGNATTPNALYENDGHGRFRDVTDDRDVSGTGYGNGGAAGDYDGDGDLDLYLCQLGPNVLYRNRGKEHGFRFEEATLEAGADDQRFSVGASFFDADRDGDLDLYVTNYCKVDFTAHEPCETNGFTRYCAPEQYEPEGHSFFRNRGDGTFEDATTSAGIAGLKGRGMGVIAADFDGDGWQDLYVANDATVNFLLHNQRDGTFRDVAYEWGVALDAHGDEQGSMGVDAADHDRDGRLDIIVTNFQKQLNALYVAGRTGVFTDLAMRQGLGNTCLPMVGWGTKFFDYDNDGWLDLFIANGHVDDQVEKYDQSSTYLQQNQLFRNRGGGALEDVSSRSGPGFAEKLCSRGAAFGDLDGDGDVDIVVSNSRQRPSLLRNETTSPGHWILLSLSGRRNRFGVGAHVALHAGGGVQRGVVTAGASYLSQNDLRLHFGLGKATAADKAVVTWPEGSIEVFEHLSADRVHTLEEGRGVRVER